MSLPDAELAWRRFRKSSPGLLNILEQAEPRRDQIHADLETNFEGYNRAAVEKALLQIPLCSRLPYLESRALYPNETEDLARAHGDAIAFWSAYRSHKRIYRIEHKIAEALTDATWPGNCPIEALVVPMSGMVIQVDSPSSHRIADMNSMSFGILLDLSWQTPFMGDMALKIMHLLSDSAVPLPIAVLELNKPTINQAYDDDRRIRELRISEGVAAREFSQNDANEVKGVLDRQIRMVINTMLYIVGNEDVVKEVHSGSCHRKRSENPVKERRFQDLADPEIFRVGQKYASAIERWEVEESSASESRGRPNRSVRPHLRGAHMHLYWTGPEGRKVQLPRFLLPIPVKGGLSAPDEPQEMNVR